MPDPTSADLLDVVILDPDRGPTMVRAAFQCHPDLIGAAVRPYLPDGSDSDAATNALQDCVNRGADSADAERACRVEISPHDPARWAFGSTWLQDRIESPTCPHLGVQAERKSRWTTRWC